MLRMARSAHRETGLQNLALAGGVALNCVGNGRLLREGPFKRLWIQPAAGDAGGALGVAQLIAHRHFKRPRVLKRRRTTPWHLSARARCRVAAAAPFIVAAPSSTRLRVSFQAALRRARRRTRRRTSTRCKAPISVRSSRPQEIESYLKIRWRRRTCELDRAALIDRVSSLMADDKVIGWFNGRMEFGPRSLGNRSIIGDPRSPRMQAQMNLKIKFRESFRPFAPSVLRERVHDYFEMDCDSPYMLLVAPVKKERQIPMTSAQQKLWGIEQLNVVRSDMPAITHIDYSARVQTVSRDTNPDYYDLIAAFEAKTGCAVIVNTSFNVRGEPIVCTPHDAYVCFMRTHIDYLVLGPFLLDKTDQPEWKETTDWRTQFQLD